MQTLMQSELTPALLDVLAHMVSGSVVIASAPHGEILYSTGEIAPRDGHPVVGVRSADYATAFQVVTQEGELAQMEDLPLVRAMRTGEPVLNEVWVLKRDDGMISVICDAYPLKNHSGAVVGALCTSVDARIWHRRSDELKVTLRIRDLLARSVNPALSKAA